MDILIAVLLVIVSWFFLKSLWAVVLFAVAVAFVIWALRQSRF